MPADAPHHETGDPRMTEPIYVARSTIAKLDTLHRRATIALGAIADFGVHGPVKEFYRLNPARELPLPVDYIAAATGG